MPGLLCVIAHPDDEVFCGGLLCGLASKGIPVHLLAVTRGEGGALGDPPVADRATIAAVREQEMQCAERAIGADSLEFLDYVDPAPRDGRLRAPEHDPDTLQTEILHAIARRQPRAVLTHGSNGDYGHPAHVMTHEIVKRAVESLDRQAPALYSFGAAFPDPGPRNVVNESDWADLVLNVSPWQEQMEAALRCHVSQWSTLLGKQDGSAAYHAALTSYIRNSPREAYHRHGSQGGEDDPLRHWMDVKHPENSFARAVQSVQQKTQKEIFRLKRTSRRVVRAVKRRL